LSEHYQYLQLGFKYLNNNNNDNNDLENISSLIYTGDGFVSDAKRA